MAGFLTLYSQKYNWSHLLMILRQITTKASNEIEKDQLLISLKSEFT